MPYLDVAKNRAAVKACHDRHREWLYSLKETTPCHDCGGFFDHYCTDYDHVGNDKVYSISKMVGHSRPRVLAEIAKCELVCIRCHRNRTRARRAPLVEGGTDKQKRERRRRREVKALVDSLKADPCTDCGQTFQPWQMDFDHRPGTQKVGSIAVLIGHRNENKVLAEIAKCDLVCAVCHRRRTHARKEYGKPKQSVTATGREEWRCHSPIREEDKDLAVQMYLDGKSQVEVAEFCGVTAPTVRALLDDRGICRRSFSEASMKLRLSERDLIPGLYRGGFTMKAIGKQLGVSEDVVRLCLRRRGIQGRTGSRPFVDQHGRIYQTQAEAAKSVGTSQGNICAVLQGQRKRARGLEFRYLSGENSLSVKP